METSHRQARTQGSKANMTYTAEYHLFLPLESLFFPFLWYLLSVFTIMQSGLDWWILMTDYQFSLCNNAYNAVAYQSVRQWDERSVNLPHLHRNSVDLDPSLPILTCHLLNDHWEIKESGKSYLWTLAAINLPHTSKETHLIVSLRQFVHCFPFVLRQHFAYQGFV